MNDSRLTTSDSLANLPARRLAVSSSRLLDSSTPRLALRLVALFALLLVAIAGGTTPGAAQSGLPCGVDEAPNDGFASAAFGLTLPELDALYGPGEATQSGWYYQFDGFGLMLSDCDLVLDVEPGSEFEDAEVMTELIASLLPDDAVLAGSWQFGTLQTAPQDADEWVSAELAARYRLLGEPRTGSILVLYTYEGNVMQPGALTQVEMRSALVPQP